MIRPAKMADIPAVREVERAANSLFLEIGMNAVADFEPTTEASLTEFIGDGRAWVFTAAADRPVAVILVSVVDANTHIEQIAVDPAFSRRGIGRLLLDQAVDWSASNGRPALTLTTFASVPWNAPYYARQGFTIVHEKDQSPAQRRMSAENAVGPLGHWPRVTMRRPVNTAVADSGAQVSPGRVQSVVAEVTDATRGVNWSICVRDAKGQVIASRAAAEVLPTASVGKVLLLLEAARQCVADPGLLDRVLDRRTVSPVEEAGLWQHLRADTLPLADVAVLVSSVSDNLATNVLLDVVGLAQVEHLATSLGLVSTRLLDQVRRERGPGSAAPYLSEGSAGELSGLMARMAARTLVSREVSEQLDSWLATDADLSMVSSRFGLDPLAHVHADRGILLRHKTGSDTGTKAEIGTLSGGGSSLSYAVVAHWPHSSSDLRDPVQRGMWRLGDILHAYVISS